MNIENNLWLIENPMISKDNISTKYNDSIKLETNFNKERINSLFSNISTLSLLELFKLKKIMKKLGYSSDEVIIHLLKLFSMPLLYGMLTVLSAMIMINFKEIKSILFHIVLVFLVSVIIYYINFIFTSLGNNGKIPIYLSIFLPIFFISVISIIGLIRVNEK